jgi:trans-aconitate 2-methyltransferase
VTLDAPARIVDLGCGAGNVTKIIRQRWPAAAVTGVDGSPQMLQRARAADPKTEWQEADVATWQPPAPVDLLYSNATLHWLGDHDTLFPKLASYVAPGGVLAVQMPRNFGEPSHTTLYEAARQGPWRARLEPLIREEPTKPAEYYWTVLGPHVKSLDVWESIYLQKLTGENPVAEFVKGSWLGPFLAALEGAERTEFENAYRARVLRAYPPRADGTTLFPFRRLFIVAQR